MSEDNDAAPTTLSILLLCWNHAAFLAKCIESLAGQSERPSQIVFLDNGSRDHSLALARKLFEMHGLSAILLRNDQAASIPANLNTLLRVSSGSLVAVLSTDDWYEPTYVQELLAAAAANSNAGWFSCGGWLFFDAEGRSEPVDEARFDTRRPVAEVVLSGGEPHFFVGCAYRRSALEKVGGWDDSQLIEDRDLFLRLADCYPHHVIGQRLVHYRRSEGAASSSAAFMIDGWERFLAKHRHRLGKAYGSHRAEIYRAYAAILTDQAKYRDATSAIRRSLQLRPFAVSTWRTFAYLARTRVLGQRVRTRNVTC